MVDSEVPACQGQYSWTAEVPRVVIIVRARAVSILFFFAFRCYEFWPDASLLSLPLRYSLLLRWMEISMVVVQ